MKYYIETYGCVLNKTDSEALMASVEKHGWKRVENPEEADILFINTCSVKEKTINHMFSRIEKLKKMGKLVVLGCLVPVFRERIDCPAFGPREWKELEKFLGVPLKKGAGAEKKREERFATAVPISEGCLGNCAYCATKIARGQLKSYPVKHIFEEIRASLEKGFKEIRLTSQDCGVYGKDMGEDLVSLLSKVLEIEGEFRVRVGMMGPESVLDLIDKGLLDVFKDSRMYKFFHIPVQSGNNRILKMMGRKYSVEDFKEAVQKIRKKFPDATISTDIIVGFPGEGWDEFLDSVKVVKDLKINVLNISRFSAIPGTKAFLMGPKVPSNEKKRRSRYLHEMHLRVARRWHRRFLREVKNILVVEEGKKGKYIGRTEEYVPVVVDSCFGEFVDVKIKKVYAHFLEGILCAT